MAVIFPDIEKVLIEYLVNSFASLDVPLSNGVRFGTVKLDPSVSVAKEVVVVGNYSGNLDRVRASAIATVDVYSPDYGTASELALLVAAVVVGISGDEVKRAVVTLGPVRLTDESPLEKRSLTVELIVKGSTL